jgi:hypothetical protein
VHEASLWPGMGMVVVVYEEVGTDAAVIRPAPNHAAAVREQYTLGGLTFNHRDCLGRAISKFRHRVLTRP